MRITSWLLFVSLLTACAGKQALLPVLQQMPNNYNLTTENVFSNELAEHIQPYFNRAPTQQFVSDHGCVKIAYRIFTPEKSPAIDKGAIVISSGRTEGMVGYQELIYDLQKQGYRVYILDHRGQGFSDHFAVKTDRERGHVDNFDYFVDDLNKFVATVVKPHE